MADRASGRSARVRRRFAPPLRPVEPERDRGRRLLRRAGARGRRAGGRARRRHRPDRDPDGGGRRARDRRRLLARHARGLPRGRGARAASGELLDLRLGDLREPPVRGARRPRHLSRSGRTCTSTTTRSGCGALRAAHDLLEPGGRLAFDVFEPATDDIEDTHGRWLEREPGIFERADWDEAERRLTLSVRGESGATTMALSWLVARRVARAARRAGFEVEACYGWFDRRPYSGGEDSVWFAAARLKPPLARRPCLGTIVRWTTRTCRL